jgi:predicted ATPase
MVLRSWRLSNFKSVQDAEVSLSPLTLLVGANSAGKSSLIQSILAATQAVNAGGDVFPLNGSTVRLGTVEQTKYAGPGASQDDRIRLGASFELLPVSFHRPISQVQMRHMRYRAGAVRINWAVELGSALATQSGRARIESVQFEVFSRPMDPDTNQDALIDDFYSIAKLAVEASEGHSKGVTTGGVQGRVPASYVGTAHVEDREVQIADLGLRGGLPTYAIILEDRPYVLWNAWRGAADALARRTRGLKAPDEANMARAAERVVDDIKWVIEQHQEDDAEAFGFESLIQSDLGERIATENNEPFDANFLYEEDFISLVTTRLQNEGFDGKMSTRDDLDDVTDPAAWVLDYLRNNVRYLGPLRDDPRVVYQDAPEAGLGYVGAKGEYCAAVLQNNGSTRVTVPKPNSNSPYTVPLNQAVNDWARFLEIGESISAGDIGRLGIQMQVKQQHVGIELDLTSVGTGVSQILPVLVMCLQAPVGALLMMEQPELHLNPRVQQRLADFLLAIARTGRHLIVETHSEYLISRLRLRVAEDPGTEVRDLVGMLFAERTDGSTAYRQVETDEFGSLNNWPHNFFDQSTEETHNILRAAVSKRRRQG